MASFTDQNELCDAAFSPDGARVLTASADMTAKLWDTASGKLLASFAHEVGFPGGVHNGPVGRAAFSPDGARILTASTDQNVKLWDAASGKLLASFAHKQGVSYGAFTPDGARILTAGTVMASLWDVASGKLIASFAHGPIWQWFLEADRPVLHFSPDGARILTVGTNNSAELLDATSGELVASFPHQDEVFQAEFSSDGARILTASRDKTAKLWDAALGKPIASFDHRDSVSWAGFSPDGTRILTVSWDKTAKLWDAATPIELARQVKEAGGDTARMNSSVSIANSPKQQVESLSEIASGLEFSGEGSLIAVNEQDRSKLTKQLKDSAQGVSGWRGYRKTVLFARAPARCCSRKAVPNSH